MQFLYYSMLLLFLTLAFFLVLLVLIQKGRGGGLSAAFGGVGGNTAFGAKTGDVLTWATSVMFGIFLVLAIGLNLTANTLHARNTNPEAPAATPTTAPTDAAAAVLDKIPTPNKAEEPPVNPTPKPPPTPTTNPSTNPVRSEVDAANAIAPAATLPAK